MNLLDICIALALGFFVFWGLRQPPIRQLSATAGALGGLTIAVIIYSKFSFLAQDSTRRGIVLLLLIGAAGFLCYDLLAAAGRYIQKRLRIHDEHSFQKRHFLSGAIAATSGALFIWLLVGMFGNVQSPVIRQHLDSSKFVHLADRIGMPNIFKQAASLINPFSSPKIFVDSEPFFGAEANVVGDEFSNLDTAVARAARSVVKISSWGCGSTSVGSGFVAAKRFVVTSAHVVAGADRMSVQDNGSTYVAQTVWFDPKLDMAVLSTSSDLDANPLSLLDGTVGNGTVAAVIGYPGGQALSNVDAIVLMSLNAQGYDIYNNSQITRRIYALRANVVPGNSGGPLINTDGKVIGLVFGHSTTQNRTGYAILSSQIHKNIYTAISQNRVVQNGSCTVK